MATVIVDISMSLDGFIAAANDRPGGELGDGGQRLHEWALDTASDREREVLDEMWAGAGAVISRARTFDVCFEGWGGEPPAGHPWFVLSQDEPHRLAKGGTAFNFVLDGVEAAVDNATSAADGKHVLVMGGPNVVQQCLQAGLVDEMQLHLVPVLFGNGIRLFEHLDAERTALETIRVIETPAATHLRFRVLRRRQ